MLTNFLYNIPYILFFMPLISSILVFVFENKKFSIFTIIFNMCLPIVLLSIFAFKLNTNSVFYTEIKNADFLMGTEYKINNFSIYFAIILFITHLIVFLNTNYEIIKAKIKDISKRKYFFVLYLIHIFSLIGIIFSANICNYFIFLDIYSLTIYVLISDYKDKNSAKASFRYFSSGICGTIILLFSIFILCIYFNSCKMAYISQKFSTVDIGSNLVLLSTFFLFIFGLILKFFSIQTVIIDFDKSMKSNFLTFFILFINVAVGVYSLLYFMNFLFNFERLLDVAYIKYFFIIFGGLLNFSTVFFALKSKKLYSLILCSVILNISLLLLALSINGKYTLYLAFLLLVEHLTVDLLLYCTYDYFNEKYGCLELKEIHKKDFYKYIFYFALIMKAGLPLGSNFYINSLFFGNISEFNSFYYFLGVLFLNKFLFAYLFFKIITSGKNKDDSFELNSNLPDRKITISRYTMFFLIFLILISTFALNYISIID